MTPTVPAPPPSYRVPAPPSYPLRAEHESWAIEQHVAAMTHMRDMLDSAYRLERLETLLKEELREGGRLWFAIKVVEAADKGDPLSDKALRNIGAELQTWLVQKRDLAPGHLQIISYYQRVSGRAPLKRKPGRYGEYDVWSRNVAICVMVMLACAWLGVPPTRNRDSRRSGRRPSGVSLTAAALARQGVHISEVAIQKHIWLGISGELVRSIPAEEWSPYRCA